MNEIKFSGIFLSSLIRFCIAGWLQSTPVTFNDPANMAQTDDFGLYAASHKDDCWLAHCYAMTSKGIQPTWELDRKLRTNREHAKHGSKALTMPCKMCQTVYESSGTLFMSSHECVCSLVVLWCVCVGLSIKSSCNCRLMSFAWHCRYCMYMASKLEHQAMVVC